MPIEISSLPAPRSKIERMIVGNIAEHGLHVWSVANRVDDPDPGPCFSYSVGLWHSTHQPEVIIVGLNPDLSHWILNEIYARRTAGERFECRRRYDGFLGGHDVMFLEAEKSCYPDFVASNLWLYSGSDFPLWQLIYPTTSGVFPWESGASKEFQENQPLLGSGGPLQ